MKIFCENQTTRDIASNPILHERIKYIEVDCHFIWKKINPKKNKTPYIKSEHQLADVFTKVVDSTPFPRNIVELGMIDSYSPLT
jgi:hypothetical protein